LLPSLLLLQPVTDLLQLLLLRVRTPQNCPVPQQQQGSVHGQVLLLLLL
jgi:hypothetical protein